MAQDLSVSTEKFEQLVSQFNYDRSEPLNVKTAGEERRDGVSIQDVSYTSSGNERVQAYWVVPIG